MMNRTEIGFNRLRDAMARVLREQVTFPPEVLVTVVDAKTTRNASNARITISVLPTSAETDVLRRLKASESDIKNQLCDILSMRRVPRLSYTCDRTEQNAATIEKELARLHRAEEL